MRLEQIRRLTELRLAVAGLARNWWAVLLRGAAAIVFGHVAIVAPVTSLAALAPLFGIYAFMDGALAMASTLRLSAARGGRWCFVAIGIVGMGTGVAVFVRPPVMNAVSLTEVIAPWALLNGVLATFAALRLRKVFGGDRLLLLSGLASIALGALLAFFPGASELKIIIGIGAYASVFGLLLLALGVRLRFRRLRALAAPDAASDRLWANP